MRVSKDEVLSLMRDKLMKHGVGEEMAAECAQVMVENSLDGIYSHGVNRFPRLISYIDKGYIRPQEKPTLIKGFGAFEQWDGNLGLGTNNARFCMNRAIELARQYGIGCIALRNTNHWMRGGAYGLQAADNGCIGICWTNTQPNMPAWGGKDRRIGNNPLIMCVPRPDGHHVMMDGAMAQFSYGAIEKARMEGRMLPCDGGFDTKGNMTRDPAEIEKTWRVLPIGLWKGSSMSIIMDMIVSSLADGNSVSAVGKLGDDEYALCQLLIAIDASRVSETMDENVGKIIEDIKGSDRVNPDVEIIYPNEMTYSLREQNLKEGIPVNDQVWQTLASL